MSTLWVTRPGTWAGIPRPTDHAVTRTQVDTIDIACWSPRTRAVASGLPDGAGIEVEGSLRLPFFATGGGRASRYEMEAPPCAPSPWTGGHPEDSPPSVGRAEG